MFVLLSPITQVRPAVIWKSHSWQDLGKAASCLLLRHDALLPDVQSAYNPSTPPHRHHSQSFAVKERITFFDKNRRSLWVDLTPSVKNSSLPETPLFVSVFWHLSCLPAYLLTMTPPWQHALSGQRFYISRSNRRRGIQPVLNHTIDNDTNLTASSTLFGKIPLTVPNYDNGEVWFFCAHISPLSASSIQKKNLIFILVAERYTKTGILGCVSARY